MAYDRACKGHAALIAAFLLSCASRAYSASGSGTWHIVTLPGKSLEIELAGVASTASWAVGAIASEEPDAKIALLRTRIEKSRAMNSLEALSELNSDYGFFGPGVCRLTVPSGEDGSVGVFVRAPAGTELHITVNGRLYSSTLLSTSFMLQDGAVRPEPLKSMATFLMRMHTPTRIPQSDFFNRNDVLYVSPEFARGHLAQFTRPPALPAGRGDRVSVYAELSVDENGNVTNVKCTASGAVNTAPLESLLLAWKFEPFVYEGRPAAVRVIAPFIFHEGTVVSPLL